MSDIPHTFIINEDSYYSRNGMVEPIESFMRIPTVKLHIDKLNAEIKRLEQYETFYNLYKELRE